LRNQRVLLMILGAALLLTGCGGLSGEPRIVATIPPPTPLPTEIGHPLTAPDLAAGAAIFAARCTDCHGINGDGNGALVQAGQIANAGNFVDPATARSQRPSDWHATITNGRIDLMMPPWREALSEQDRWNVGYYTYTLHYTDEEIERGRELFAAHCAECHGESGRGDGERAVEFDGGVKDLTNQRVMATLSDQAIWNTINEGIGMADMGMPGFGDDLSDSDMWAITAYARTLSLANTQIIASRAAMLDVTAEPAADVGAQSTAPVVSTEEPSQSAQSPTAQTIPSQPGQTDAQTTPQTIIGTVTGRVINGSAGGSVPANQPVTLFVFDPEQPEPDIFNAAADANGEFTIPNVLLNPSAQYVMSTLYRDRVYTSGLTAPAANANTLDISLNIYELTEDPSVIEIARMVTQVTALETTLEVAQVFNFRNTSDRAFSTNQATQNGRPISVVISMPPGSLIAGFTDNQERYVVIPEDFLVVDTAPVLPGDSHIVQVVYYIPYEGDAIIDQQLYYTLDGTVRLLLRPDTVRIESAQYPPLGEETIGETAYQAYGGTLNLSEGGVISYRVRGAGTSIVGDTISTNNLPLLIAIVIVGELLLIGGLVVWFRRRRAKTKGTSLSLQEQIDALVRQIADLEVRYERGEIDEPAFQQQRTALRDELAALMSAPKK